MEEIMKTEAIKALIAYCRLESNGDEKVVDVVYFEDGVCMQSDEFRRLLDSAEEEIEEIESAAGGYPVVGIAGILMVQNPSD